MDSPPVRSFGEQEEDAEYRLRPSAYVVLVNSRYRHVAVVQTPLGVFLPGGGMEGHESPVEAAIREAREECGLDVDVGEPIGTADQYLFSVAEGIHYLKRSSFFRATLRGSDTTLEPSHELSWLPWQVAAASMSHESHGWAVRECLGSAASSKSKRSPRPMARLINSDDPERLHAAFGGTVWERDIAAYQQLLDEHRSGRREVWVGVVGPQPVGFASILWSSEYPPFREAGIAELSDLNVVPSYRRRGVATCIMDAAEVSASRKCTPLGIGVGLHAGYGAAQRMYARRGYVPDGGGVSHRGRVPEEGESLPLDDDLVVYLLKERGSA